VVVYCTLYDLKKRLQIEVGDFSSDPELEDVIMETQAIMNEDLANSVVFPLTIVTDLLKFACADCAYKQ
jgi:hypothetical protein